jgi:hypothetical protein
MAMALIATAVPLAVRTLVAGSMGLHLPAGLVVGEMGEVAVGIGLGQDVAGLVPSEGGAQFAGADRAAGTAAAVKGGDL